MYNWSVDEKKFKKKYPNEYRFWRITQLINYGLEEGEKLDREEVKKAWPKIKEDLDPNKALYLKYLLWQEKPSSSQFTADFWRPSTRKNI